MAVVAGCSNKTPHLSLPQWPIAQRAMYYRAAAPYRLGVSPLFDQRPVVERQGQRPAGCFLLVWNRRVGDYYTGDHVFGGQVALHLTEHLIEYLRAANVFADVTPVAPSEALHLSGAGAIGRVGRDHQADYLLGGQLEHFFGSQSQHTSIYLLPLYFVSTFGWHDAKSLPWGRTAIDFTLYEGRTGQIVWRRLIEADHTLPRESDTMSEAAWEAFVETAGRLAVDLRQLPLEPMDRPGQGL